MLILKQVAITWISRTHQSLLPSRVKFDLLPYLSGCLCIEMTPYEELREANIRRNKALLRDLDLKQPFFEPKAKPKAVREKQPKKRKTPPSVENERRPPAKAFKSDLDQSPTSMTESLRRSGRHAGKSVNYTETKTEGQPLPVSVKARMVDGFVVTEARKVDRRVHDP
jgi:hypothetical protein